jgi:hypothetical protein
VGVVSVTLVRWVLQKAAELQKRADAGREEFEFGVTLYERGRYADSEKMLYTALDIAGERLTLSNSHNRKRPSLKCAQVGEL